MQTLVQDDQLACTIAEDQRGVLWTGRILAAIAVTFLMVDGLGKLLQARPVVEATTQLGYPPDVVFSLGVILLACTGVYVLPQTSPLGAVLLTAYLGGAVATHVRVGSPLVTHVLVPTYIAALLWGSLVLRDTRLRAFLPWGSRRQS